MEAYLCRGRYIVNLKYDWLVNMSLGGAVVSFYHVTSFIYRMKLSIRALDFGTLGYR